MTEDQSEPSIGNRDAPLLPIGVACLRNMNRLRAAATQGHRRVVPQVEHEQVLFGGTGRRGAVGIVDELEVPAGFTPADPKQRMATLTRQRFVAEVVGLLCRQAARSFGLWVVATDRRLVPAGGLACSSGGDATDVELGDQFRVVEHVDRDRAVVDDRERKDRERCPRRTRPRRPRR